jgi:hypothetical protein
MPTFKPHRKYTAAIEVIVEAKDDGQTVLDADSVAAATRSYLRRVLPPKFTPAGYRYDLATIEVSAEEKANV